MRGLRSVFNAYIASLFPAGVPCFSRVYAASLLACTAVLLLGCGHKGPLIAPERGNADNNHAATVHHNSADTAESEPTTLPPPETHTH